MEKYNINDINYKETGDGKKILFLHGWGSSLTIFDDIISYLKPSYHCLSLDLPGFGNSKEGNESLTIKEYSTLLNEFLMEHNFKPDLIVGHSFGGKIAIEYTINYSYDNKLFLCAPSIIKPKRKVSYYVKRGLYKSTKKFEKLNKYIKNKVSSSDYNNASEILKGTLINSCTTYYDEELKNITNKTFIYWGVEDTTTPINQAKKVHKLMKNSSLLLIEGGHFAFIDNKYNFINTIENFMEDNK